MCVGRGFATAFLIFVRGVRKYLVLTTVAWLPRSFFELFAIPALLERAGKTTADIADSFLALLLDALGDALVLQGACQVLPDQPFRLRANPARGLVRIASVLGLEL